MPKVSYKLAECEDDTRPGLVHRIDKNTSGIIVVAKTHMHWFTYKSNFMTELLHVDTEL